MLVLSHAFIKIYLLVSLVVATQTTKCKYSNLDCINQQIIESQSMGRIVNNQRHTNTASNHHTEINDPDSIFDKTYDSMSSTPIHSGGDYSPIGTSHASALPTTMQQYSSNSDSSLISTSNSIVAHKFNSVTNIDTIIPSTQNIHIHHHYISLKGSKKPSTQPQYKQPEVLPVNTNYQYMPNFQNKVINLNSRNNTIENNANYNYPLESVNQNFFINDQFKQMPQESIYNPEQIDIRFETQSNHNDRLGNIIKNKIDQITPVTPVNIGDIAVSQYSDISNVAILATSDYTGSTKVDVAQKFNEISPNMTLISDDIVVNYSSTTLPPSENEYSAYDVPLN